MLLAAINILSIYLFLFSSLLKFIMTVKVLRAVTTREFCGSKTGSNVLVCGDRSVESRGEGGGPCSFVVWNSLPGKVCVSAVASLQTVSESCLKSCIKQHITHNSSFSDTQ